MSLLNASNLALQRALTTSRELDEQFVAAQEQCQETCESFLHDLRAAPGAAATSAASAAEASTPAEDTSSAAAPPAHDGKEQATEPHVAIQSQAR